MPAPLSLARQRKLRRRRRVLYFGFGGAVIVAIICGFLFSKDMTVKQVSVLSLPVDYHDFVSKIVWDHLGDDYWRVIPGDHGALAAAFRQDAIRRECFRTFPELSWLSIKYDIPAGTIIVDGGLRHPVAKACDQNGFCMFLDAEGVVFSDLRRDVPVPDYLINLTWELNEPLSSQTTINASMIHFISEFYELSENIFQINGFAFREHYFQAGTVYALISPGWDLLLDERTRPYIVINNLKTLFTDKLDMATGNIQYIDARFEDRVYYRLR